MQAPRFSLMIPAVVVGLMFGHAVAYLFLIPSGYGRWYGDRLLIAMVAGGFGFVCLTAICEKQLLWLARKCGLSMAGVWILLVIAVIVYLFIAPAVLFGARE
jgi:hypothetical protein